MLTAKGAQTTARLAESMLESVQSRGYSGTGLNTVVERSGAPKGSLYFHFPDGKEALGERAVGLATEQFRELITGAIAGTGGPGELVRQLVGVLAGLLTESDFQLGCPVSVVTLEMGANSERLRQACAGAFEAWIQQMTEYLSAQGHNAAAARRTATAMVGTIEGAVIISRAQRSVEPLRCAADFLTAMLEQPVASIAMEE